MIGTKPAYLWGVFMEPYLIYPENQAYVRGAAAKPVSIIGPNGCAVLFNLLFILAGLSILSFGLNALRENLLLSSESITTEGRVVSRYTKENDDGVTYYVVFEYVANDRRLTREQQVDEALYTRAEQGARLEIEYSSVDPSAARIAGTNSWLLSMGALVAGSLLTLVSSVFLVKLIKMNRRLRDRLQKGKLIKGQLLEVSTGEDRDYEGEIYTCTIVKARFRTPAGRTIQGEKRYRTTRGKEHPPSNEETVAIFYIDDKDWEVL